MRIKLTELIAINNKQEAFDHVVSKGLPKPKNTLMLVKELDYLVKQGGEEALLELAEIHPDRELIIASYEKDSKKENINEKPEEKKSSACGCSGADGGDEPNLFVRNQIDVKSVLIGAFSVIAVWSVVTLVKK